MNPLSDTLNICEIAPLQHYGQTWQAMRQFTQQRGAETLDEVWLLQHHPVFTQGKAGKAEHVLQRDPTIPIVASDRGGQVTYHGPGQLIVYFLLDLRRRHMGIRQLVTALENVVIELLAEFAIVAHAKKEAPGVYVQADKICSIGLRVSRGCSYHGIALNVDMDLTPFSYINPCGYPELTMTQINDLVEQTISLQTVQQAIIDKIREAFE